MKYEKQAKQAIIIAAAIFILYRTARGFIREARKKKSQQSGRRSTVDASGLSQINHEALALQMSNAINGIFETSAEKTASIEAWMQGNDEDFKHLCNIYNANYVTPPDTIRNELLGELAINYFKRSAFINRLDELGIA